LVGNKIVETVRSEAEEREAQLKRYLNLLTYITQKGVITPRLRTTVINIVCHAKVLNHRIFPKTTKMI